MTASSAKRAKLFATAALLALAAPAAAAGLTYTTPAGWQATRPESSMRVAEFTLPRAAGDAEDAQLIIYYFGGEGGSVDANIERWQAQVRQPDGKPTVAHRDERTVNGLHVTLIDVTGRYVAGAMPGGGQSVDKADVRMRAGVIQTPRGPYFLKLTGPRRTVTKWDRAFEAFIASVRYQG